MKSFQKYLILLATILTTACTSLFHHPSGDVKDYPVIRKSEPGFASINPDTIQQYVYTLAADSMQGRETTYPGQKKAARYLARHLKQFGLLPIDSTGNYLQEIPMTRTYLTDSLQASVIGSDTTSLGYKTDFIMRPGRITKDTTFTAPVVFCGYGIQSDKYGIKDYDSVDVEDKWALVISGEPQSTDPLSIFDGEEASSWSGLYTKVWAARQAGALGVIVAGNQLEQTRGDSTHSFMHALEENMRELDTPVISLRETPKQNKSFIIYVDDSTANQLVRSTGHTLLDYQRRIEKHLKSVATLLPEQFYLNLRVRIEPARAENVVGVLPGRDQRLEQRYVVVSAHYDHLGVRNDSIIYNGADDNASGTSAVLSVAKAFNADKIKPKRSILILFVSGEEKGLLGSTYFVNHAPVPLEQISADINLDMIGRNAPDSLYVIGSNMLSADLDTLTRNAANDVPGLYLDYAFNSRNEPYRYYFRSDQYNFAKIDIPVVFFFAGTHEDYHKPTDTPDKLNYVKISKVARLAYLIVRGTANLPQELRLNGVMARTAY